MKKSITLGVSFTREHFPIKHQPHRIIKMDSSNSPVRPNSPANFANQIRHPKFPADPRIGLNCLLSNYFQHLSIEYHTLSILWLGRPYHHLPKIYSATRLRRCLHRKNWPSEFWYREDLLHDEHLSLPRCIGSQNIHTESRNAFRKRKWNLNTWIHSSPNQVWDAMSFAIHPAFGEAHVYPTCRAEIRWRQDAGWSWVVGDCDTRRLVHVGVDKWRVWGRSFHNLSSLWAEISAVSKGLSRRSDGRLGNKMVLRFAW